MTGAELAAELRRFADLVEGLYEIHELDVTSPSGLRLVVGSCAPVASHSRRNFSAVHERDGAACRYCGSERNLSIDHVVPRIQGGSNELENLVVACRSCNSRKGGRTPEQAGMVLQ